MKKALLFSWISIFVLLGCSGTRPATLGVTKGRLAPCPDAPHCVSTQSEDEGHRIKPFSYTTSHAEALEKLLTIIRSMKRTKIISIKNDYLHAECTSAFFRYVDDVEFYFPNEPLIHVRSASRVGYSDLGVNRKRVEHLRNLYSGK